MRPDAGRDEGLGVGRSIALEAVSKRYGGELVVDRVDAQIGAGEFFSLLGPSGSGKTTTLMMIAGFATPDAGVVRIGGEDVTHTSPQKRGLGMVIQNYALFPHLSVFENVAFPLRIRRLPRAEIATRAAEALATVRLQGFERRRPRELSGGQQQRVALARAVVFRPAIVMMDEPLGALDKNLRFQMQAEIKDIQRRLGMTVVYVTHDQEEAMNMSDRLAIMDRGRIVQVGAPRDVYERPATPFAARFLGDANLLDGRAGPGRFVTAAGRSLPLPPEFSGDGATWLFVRPEKVRLESATAAADGPGLAGRVERAAFLGSVVRYTVDVGERDLILADMANDGRPLWSVGDAVTAAWAPDAARLIAGEAA